MDLLTEELTTRVMDKDLRKLIDRIGCYEMMRERAELNLANGRIEDAICCVEEQLRDLREIGKMAEEASAWEQTHRVMAALQGMGFDIRKVEVKHR